MEKFVLIVSVSICLLGPGEQEDIGLHKYNKEVFQNHKGNLLEKEQAFFAVILCCLTLSHPPPPLRHLNGSPSSLSLSHSSLRAAGSCAFSSLQWDALGQIIRMQ
jgi:hypothetical protein